jgi:hypothetical protein
VGPDADSVPARAGRSLISRSWFLVPFPHELLRRRDDGLIARRHGYVITVRPRLEREGVGDLII